ncbi:unnamed protein product [Rotaria sordida]|uniref:Uncharacterized protein n=1 Tax=Rotaria sordida TaxID=392033 RepID=A0A815EAE1_9BILA|nr:unnamed protein product [Rotaria sordida]
MASSNQCSVCKKDAGACLCAEKDKKEQSTVASSEARLDCNGRACQKCGKCRDWDGDNRVDGGTCYGNIPSGHEIVEMSGTVIYAVVNRVPAVDKDNQLLALRLTLLNNICLSFF